MNSGSWVDGGGRLELSTCARYLPRWVGRGWLGRTPQAKDTNDGLGVGGRWDVLSALTQ